MMSWFADLLAKLAILIIEVCFFGGAAFGFIMMNKSHNSDNTKHAYMIASIVLVVLGCLFTCMLCCYWKSVKIAIALIDATADFFAATKRLIFYQFAQAIKFIIVFVLWAVACACISGINTVTPSKTIIQGKDIHWHSNTVILEIFMFVAFIWTCLVMMDFQGYVTMVSASTFYMSSTKEKEGSASVMTGIKFGTFKNLGSICLGSFVQTIVFFIRLAVDSIVDQAQKKGDGLMCIIACCAKCCVGCLEDIVDYITKTAYAYMALSGDSFCSSAWNGFLLNLKHVMKFYYATTLASMFILMGKLMITAFNCLTLWLILKYGTHNKADISSLTAPLVVIGVESLIVAHIFLSQFDEAVIATITCMAVDMDLNDGVCQHGPPTFHQKMQKIQEGDYTYKRPQRKPRGTGNRNQLVQDHQYQQLKGAPPTGTNQSYDNNNRNMMV